LLAVINSHRGRLKVESPDVLREETGAWQAICGGVVSAVLIRSAATLAPGTRKLAQIAMILDCQSKIMTAI
jgi:hypothetical protein